MNEPDLLRVCLTFDAEHPDRSRCPPGNTERILDILAGEEVRATFFVQGRWAQSAPATARRIADDGHLIGHHSFYHARMPLLSRDGLRTDVADGHRAIAEFTGADPRPWLRCPFGAGHDDQQIVDGLQEMGYRNVHWNVELQDWEPWRTGDSIARDAIHHVGVIGDGAVVLLHTWSGGTSDALAPMIVGLRDVGATFATVDRLERLP